jgi:hypothetical protein
MLEPIVTVLYPEGAETGLKLGLLKLITTGGIDGFTVAVPVTKEPIVPQAYV